jgi:sterol desaturase/sphingolipid hydroxylase (fatty acid hydroxylase superfamily)
MTEYLHTAWNYIESWYFQIGQLGGYGSFVFSALIFMPLALLWPGKRSQPLVHKGMIPDAMYWFFAGPLFYVHVSQWIGLGLIYLIITCGIYTAEQMHHLQNGIPPVSNLPVLLQAFLILLLMDCMQYWSHRMFHTMKFWKFHAIHHSAVNVDWLSAARFHPVNIIIHSTFVGTLVYMVGFSAEAWAVLIPFNIIYSPLVHANLNWTYGPFRYFLASPVFHRWHHTSLKEGGNKNFAPTFPFLDILFGTYYDPKDKRPQVFGTEHDPIADDDLLNQLIYPFIRRPKVSAETIKAELAEGEAANKENPTTTGG